MSQRRIADEAGNGGMGQPLRLLIVDDSEADAELTLLALRRAGLDPEFDRVDTPEELAAALERRAWDAIVCDYSMPRFDAPSAFRLVKKKGLDLPFIIVSGTVGEESAVAAMKLGVHDYLTKGHLARLGPAIEREIGEAKGRAARRLAEAQLRQSEERYRALFDGSPLPTWVIDLDTLVFIAVNDAAVRHYGYNRDDFKARTLDQIGLLTEPMQLGHGLAGPLAEVESNTWRHRKKDGTIILVEVRAHDFDFEARRARLMLINDVTELRNTEEQLRHAQKMEAVGRLAGGIAHDFNNLLGVILSYNELVLGQIPEQSPVRSDIEEVTHAALRAADLTRQLLAFSRQQVLQPRVLDLNTVVHEMEKMIERLIGEDIELTFSLAPDLGCVEVDAGQVGQVIMNLVINSRDAMPEGGKIVIETANVDLDAQYAARHPETSPGRYVMLAVSDTGIGMDATTQARIFEPFFTTKEIGKGTGLGLSTVFGIVKQSNGHIWVYSEPGAGSTFKVYLPAVDRPIVTVSAEIRPNRGDEKILIVEDEPALRQAIVRVLHAAGYDTTVASNGAEALAMPRVSEVDLVLTDLVMPSMGGRDLVRQLRERNPGIRSLYMSGYTDRGALHAAALEHGDFFLQKPFTPEALRQKVREVLERKE